MTRLVRVYLTGKPELQFDLDEPQIRDIQHKAQAQAGVAEFKYNGESVSIYARHIQMILVGDESVSLDDYPPVHRMRR